MSSILDPNFTRQLTNMNVTTRRLTGGKKSKMATAYIPACDLEQLDSLVIEDILSNDEAKDVVTMLSMANELDGGRGLPSFCTSTQTGNRDPGIKPASPPLSPITFPDARLATEFLNDSIDFGTTLEDLGQHLGETPLCGDSFKKDFVHLLLDGGPPTGNARRSAENTFRDVSSGTAADKTSQIMIQGTKDGTNSNPDSRTGADPEVGTGALDDKTSTMRTAGRRRSEGDAPEVRPSATVRHPSLTCSEGSGSDDDEDSNNEGEAIPDVLSLDGDGDDIDYLVPSFVASKLRTMNASLTQLNKNSMALTDTVKDLEQSLEFSQSEIIDLKKENASLKRMVEGLELEDRRTQFQLKEVTNKVDKVDAATKKKNLIFEGLPELDGRREEVEKTICDLFDDLNVNKGIYFDACFRVGPYNKDRTRPILVSFERQSDRDLIYAKRAELQHTNMHKRVWINEDLNPALKRKRGLIRLITKEAQQQGFDCKSGKYNIQIDKAKYDEDNFDDLPPQLHPTSLKQVQIDQHTIAYQSEHAPFSNFFPSKIVIGKHSFFCAEQAFQFLRAKLLNKPLLATKIYLSREVRDIKQYGAELGTSEEWEGRQFDYMYICLKKKFVQNPDLRALLLKSGNMKLVEATPDRLWGCGATLSSNVLRKHEWKGQNKHGSILEIVREELRQSHAQT